MAQTDSFRLVVVADLASSDQSSQGVTLATAKDFAELMRKHAPRLRFEVPDLIRGGSASLSVDIAASTLKDLAPRSLVDRLSSLARCRELIERLQAVPKGKRAAADVGRLAAACEDLPALAQLLRTGQGGQSAITETGPASQVAASRTAAAEDESVGRIMNMVRAPDVDERAAAVVSALLGGSSRGRGSGAATSKEPQDSRNRAGALLSRQLDSILHHPQFRRAEATWRGLKLLVDRTRFRNGGRLTVHHASRTELEEVITKTIVEPAEQGSVPAPDLWIAPTLFEDAEADAALLSKLARQAESIRSPLLVSVASGFAVASSSWQSLRQLTPAVWLAAATNPFLARAPYSGQHRGLTYDEALGDTGQLPWADPVWAVASSVVRSYQNSGWPTEILGLEGRVDDLPVLEIATKAGRSMTPLQEEVSEKRAHELAAAGVMALCAQRDSDSAFLIRAPMVHDTGDQATVKGTTFAFAQQLLVSRVARAVERFRGARVVRTPEETQEALERHLSDVLSSSGPSSWVDVRVSQTEDGLVASIDLKTGRGVLGGARVELDFKFGR